MRRLTRIGILLSTICLLAASVAPAANASIGSFTWIGPVAKNTYDSFYGTTVTGYEEGTAATFVVNVNNNYPGGDPINLSAVKLSFDWGQNYTSTETSLTSPYVLDYGESHVFTITFTVPNASIVNNFVTHGYTIYAEHVNSTTGPKRIVSWWDESYTGFAVLSQDQADAKLALKDLDAYPPMTLPFFTARARELLTESSIAESRGNTEYAAGNFATAKTNYQNALNLLQNAYSNETDRWGSIENTLQGLLSGAQSMLVNQGWAWLLFGIAFLLMGIGAIVYLVRKSGTPKTS
jgi:FlaG/FlaF family flagellin (archaellin)